ncbi:hypothetical protein, partial [Paraburkholderia xenovorans]|uniref:hypothetical protein n=1 Tax=Paraburkholderia xenovorans TaxID=36873 RepID=UPI001C12EF25
MSDGRCRAAVDETIASWIEAYAARENASDAVRRHKKGRLLTNPTFFGAWGFVFQARQIVRGVSPDRTKRARNALASLCR